ncbi:MAG: magnesium transporter [Clostridiales bacterium]|nr:magnesium transporter [Clostridiales bacterium]MDY2921154.1 magnesium transporter [Lentihominibacter sp.]
MTIQENNTGIQAQVMDMEAKNQRFEDDLEEMLELLENSQYISARNLLLKYNEVDIGEMLEEVLDEAGVEKTIILFRMLPKNVSVEVFSYLPGDDQVKVINGITDREISYIMEEMNFDDKIDVLEELPANIVDKILDQTPREERKLINTFLKYPEDSAGSLMTPDYISLQETMTVEEALDHIKRQGMTSETVYTCYVKHGGRELKGIVSLSSLVTAEKDTKVSDLMHTDYVYLNVYDDQEDVAEAFKKYGFLAIPVVDNENRLVGIVTVDDVMDVIEEETTEDIERMAGVMNDDSDVEYLDIGVFRHVKNRLPWLLFMTVTLMITGTLISQFEAVLSQVIVLVAYLPLLMGTGGNTGTQAATLVIRGLSVDEIDLKDSLKVLWKEFRVSLILGLVLSVFNFAKIMLIDGEPMMIAMTVSLSMIIVVTFAKILGGMLPMLAKKVGVDPALMATPMISSITDMFSSCIYLLMASILLGVAI